jgi:hypothetical protein
MIKLAAVICLFGASFGVNGNSMPTTTQTLSVANPVSVACKLGFAPGVAGAGVGFGAGAGAGFGAGVGAGYGAGVGAGYGAVGAVTGMVVNPRPKIVFKNNGGLGFVPKVDDRNDKIRVDNFDSKDKIFRKVDFRMQD